MVRHHILANDLEFHLEFLRGIKNRIVDEKFLYLGSNAKKFYESVSSIVAYNSEDVPTIEDKMKEIMNIVSPSRSTAFISIGCGDSHTDRDIVARLLEKKYKIEYFGVDSSRSMLQGSEENVKHLSCDSALIFADFMSRSFANEIKYMTKDFDQRIFVFWDNTIGNLKQTACVDSLYNIMQKNDLLVVEASLRTGKRKEDDIQVFKKYMSYIEKDQELMLEFLHYPLKKIDVERDKGRVIIETFYEDSVGAIGARFSFLMTQPKKVTFRDEVLHFLPSERISILEMRQFDPDTFTEFFEGHDFALKSSYLLKKRGLFTFERF